MGKLQNGVNPNMTATVQQHEETLGSLGAAGLFVFRIVSQVGTAGVIQDPVNNRNNRI